MKNLLCPDRILSILIFISCGILIFYGIFFSCKKAVKTNTFDTVKLLENSLYPNFMYIPVTIDDKVYPFVFDSGMAYSVIDSGFAGKIGLSADDTYPVEFSNLELVKTESFDSLCISNKIYYIGKFKIKSLFILNGVKGEFVKTDLMQKAGAVLGMEIIQQLNWLFDFDNTTVTISKDQIKIPALPDDQILTLDFYSEQGSSTWVDLNINGVIIQNVLFDTGYEYTFRPYGKNKSMDMIFSKSDYEVYSRIPHVSLSLTKDHERTYIFDSVKINNFEMQGLFALEHKECTHSFITANFVRRFRMMYYDSINKKIQLYVSPSDSVRHHRRDMQNIYKAILPFFQNTDSNKIDIPLTFIDSLWQTN